MIEGVIFEKRINALLFFWTAFLPIHRLREHKTSLFSLYVYERAVYPFERFGHWLRDLFIGINGEKKNKKMCFQEKKREFSSSYSTAKGISCNKIFFRWITEKLLSLSRSHQKSCVNFWRLCRERERKKEFYITLE